MGIGFDILRVPLRRVARPVIPPIQPRHEPTRLVPDAENKDHSAAERLSHSLHPAVSLKRGAVRTECLRQGIALARHGLGILDHFPILHIEPADLRQLTGGRIVGRDELRHDGKRLAGVDGAALGVKLLDALCVSVEAAPCMATHAADVALGALADIEAWLCAAVRSVFG